jgi:hypothetical protein
LLLFAGQFLFVGDERLPARRRPTGLTGFVSRGMGCPAGATWSISGANPSAKRTPCTWSNSLSGASPFFEA